GLDLGRGKWSRGCLVSVGINKAKRLGNRAVRIRQLPEFFNIVLLLWQGAMQLKVLTKRAIECVTTSVNCRFNCVSTLAEPGRNCNTNQCRKQNRDDCRIGKADSRRAQSDKLVRVCLDTSNDARAAP